MNRRAWLVWGALGAVGCATKSTPFDYGAPKSTYQLRGVVLRVRSEARVAVIQHEKIEGWMEAMTMEFPVPSESEFARLKPGVKVRATVCVNDLYFWLSGVTVE
jgi:Cu/Ag efflux protein CusF